jgi:ligand-binding sensor protein
VIKMAKVKRDKLDVEHLKISDLIPVEDIQKIQDSFAYAFGCAANILNPDGTFICKGSNFYFCHQYFNRKTALGRERCRKSDEAIGREAVRSKKAVIRFCTNGHLIDGAAPVIIEGKHIATVFAGQILFEPPKEKDLEIYRKIARELGVDEEEYIESLKNVHIIPEEKFRKAVDHLVQIAATLATAAYQKLKEHRMRGEIQNKIEEIRERETEIELAQ